MPSEGGGFNRWGSQWVDSCRVDAKVELDALDPSLLLGLGGAVRQSRSQSASVVWCELNVKGTHT